MMMLTEIVFCYNSLESEYYEEACAGVTTEKLMGRNIET